MKKKKKTGISAGAVILILVLILIILTIVKPETVSSFLQVLGKGSGKIRLTSVADNFDQSMGQIIDGFTRPKDQDPTLLTTVKILGVEAIGLFAAMMLGSVIARKLRIRESTGFLYAYLPCTAAVFLINGVGTNNIYLIMSAIMMAFTALFS